MEKTALAGDSDISRCDCALWNHDRHAESNWRSQAIGKQHNKTVILDAMSSFGGIPMDIADLGIDYMISSASASKVYRVFASIIAKQSELKSKGQARSLSLICLTNGKHCMESNGKWRFNFQLTQCFLPSPTWTWTGRRYRKLSVISSTKPTKTTLLYALSGLNHCLMMIHSPIITSSISPTHSDYQFMEFYDRLKNGRKNKVLWFTRKVFNLQTASESVTRGEVYPVRQ